MNTCTSNPSAVPPTTSELTEDPKFPLFAGHFECLRHVLNTICKKTISGLCRVGTNVKVDNISDEYESQLENDQTNSEGQLDEYYDINNNNPSVYDSLNNLFNEIPMVLKKLIDVSTELKRSDDKMYI